MLRTGALRTLANSSVRPTVSTAKKYQITDSMTSQATKMDLVVPNIIQSRGSREGDEAKQIDDDTIHRRTLSASRIQIFDLWTHQLWSRGKSQGDITRLAEEYR